MLWHFSDTNHDAKIVLHLCSSSFLFVYHQHDQTTTFCPTCSIASKYQQTCVKENEIMLKSTTSTKYVPRHEMLLRKQTKYTIQILFHQHSLW
jgi:hypothetical protein